jgi:hypothetical protein
MTDRDQLALFPALASNEPGDARVTLAAPVRSNIAAGHTGLVLAPKSVALSSPVARRIYRILEAHRAEHGDGEWAVPLERLAELLPLSQRFPSHLQRVLQPAHEMLLAGGIVTKARFVQDGRTWRVEYL